MASPLGSAVAESADGSMRKAMAFRVKYRTNTKRLPLHLLGVHQRNRGGVYPQGETVQNLALTILKNGFSSSEADHEGVCVQEVPYEHRLQVFKTVPRADWDPLTSTCFDAWRRRVRHIVAQPSLVGVVVPIQGLNGIDIGHGTPSGGDGYIPDRALGMMGWSNSLEFRQRCKYLGLTHQAITLALTTRIAVLSESISDAA